MNKEMKDSKKVNLKRVIAGTFAAVALGLTTFGTVNAFAAPSSTPSASASASASATPNSNSHKGDQNKQADLSKLAQSLGVSETQLQNALSDIRQQDRSKMKQEQSDRDAAIAKELGVSVSDLQNAMKPDSSSTNSNGKPDFRNGHLDFASIANKLGKSESDVQKAFNDNRPQFNKGDNNVNREDELAAALAKDLNLDQSKVKAALEANHPTVAEGHSQGFGGHKHHK